MPDSNYPDLTGFRMPTDPMALYGQTQQQPMFDPNFGNTGAPMSTNYGAGLDGSGGGIDSGGLNFFNHTDKNGVTQQGWGGTAIGGAQALFNAWMGMKSYGLAKQQLAEGKRQFQLNYDAQRSMTNTQLQDRQAARVASNPGAYQSVGDYMAQHAIQPSGG